MTRVRLHLRQNIVGYAALFVALSGTAYAVDGSLPGKNTVGSEDIIDGQVLNSDLGPDSVGTGKVLNQTLVGADVKDRSLTGTDLQDGSVTGLDIAESSLDSAIVQRRVSGACTEGRAMVRVDFGGGVTCTHTRMLTFEKVLATTPTRTYQPLLTIPGVGTLEVDCAHGDNRTAYIYLNNSFNGVLSAWLRKSVAPDYDPSTGVSVTHRTIDPSTRAPITSQFGIPGEERTHWMDLELIPYQIATNESDDRRVSATIIGYITGSRCFMSVKMTSTFPAS